MKRRNFLRTMGALGLPAVTGLAGVKAATTTFSSLINPDSDRVLVIIHLFGGNDGLNTLIPLDQLSALNRVRRTIALPERELLSLSATKLALHPKMPGMQNLFNEGQLGIVQNVGYPDQNRSHFRSTDIWNSSSDSDIVLNTGWLGRYFDELHPGYPDGYPNDDHPHPPAISISNVAHPTCAGDLTNYSQTILDPTQSTLLAPGGDTPLPGDNYGDEVSYLRSVVEQNNAYGTSVKDAANRGYNAAAYPEKNELADQLRKVALMISGGLRTKVYTVYLGGFDTHADQANAITSTGAHAEQLQKVSEAISSFQQDLNEQGISERVLGMTFSEFGRRIRPNASRGTDHGDAAPMFLFGQCTQSAVIGDSPEIDPAVDPFTGVAMQFDFRDVYGSILLDWFQVEESRIRRILYHNFQHLPIVSGCAAALPVTLLNFTAMVQGKAIKLAWQTADEIDNQGFHLERSKDGGRDFRQLAWIPTEVTEAGGGGRYAFTDTNILPGIQYYYRLRQKNSDGSFDYSPLRSASIDSAGSGSWQVGSIYPNPAQEQINLPLSAPTDGRIRYEIFNLTGQRIINDSTSVAGGSTPQRISINVGRLPSGTYHVNVHTPDGDVHRQHLVVQQR